MGRVGASWKAAAAGAVALGTLAFAHASQAQTVQAQTSLVRLKADPAPVLLPVALQTTADAPVQPWSVPTPHKTLQLDSKGRWGVRLDMEEPTGRSAEGKDVTAGAYLSLTSRLRIGGAVGFGDRFANPTRMTPEDAAAPRVKLETRFKF